MTILVVELEEGAARGPFTVPELVRRMSPADRQKLLGWASTLRDRTALDLCASVGVARDPTRLWVLHANLHRRGIYPVLRGGIPHEMGRQGHFIEFCADVLWLASIYGHHLPRSRLARALLKATPGSDAWWTLAQRLYARTGDVRARVIALAMPGELRPLTRTMMQARDVKLFERLHGPGFGVLLSMIEESLRRRPDKSGATDPREVALRRAYLWRISQLGGGGPTLVARNWQALSGVTLSRQAVAKQLEAVHSLAVLHERAGRE
ncbi:hypothetical protein ACWKW4_04695 [Hydrogenophaga borbori]|uniref:hypothetical protein n=1 Tax=Hydrogenophaga borbori TaxID=2294117 RepID=UPI00301CA34E